MTNFEMVKEFHKAFRIVAANVPTPINEERKKLRRALIVEELTELDEAMEDENLIGIADGLADLLYVVYGTAVEYGIDIDAVFAEVHRSNMTKLDTDGNPILRHDGKILKSINYCPPDIQGVLDRQFEWLDSVTRL